MRAWVIDDEEDVRRILALMLGRLGFDVKPFATAGEALVALENERPADVVFLDWKMPQMDGMGFLKVVRADPALEKMRVMMVTGLSEMRQIEEALEAGADEYLMKPITQQMLREKLTVIGL